MIRSEKLDAAHAALNTILIAVRQMAIDKATHGELVDVLDVAEELPTLFFGTEDRTEYFGAVLKHLATKHASFAKAVEQFAG